MVRRFASTNGMTWSRWKLSQFCGPSEPGLTQFEYQLRPPLGCTVISGVPAVARSASCRFHGLSGLSWLPCSEYRTGCLVVPEGS